MYCKIDLRKPPKTCSMGQDLCSDLETTVRVAVISHFPDGNTITTSIGILGRMSFILVNIHHRYVQSTRFSIDHVLVKVTGPWRLDSYKTVRERPDHNAARIFHQSFWTCWQIKFMSNIFSVIGCWLVAISSIGYKSELNGLFICRYFLQFWTAFLPLLYLR